MTCLEAHRRVVYSLDGKLPSLLPCQHCYFYTQRPTPAWKDITAGFLGRLCSRPHGQACPQTPSLLQSWTCGPSRSHGTGTGPGTFAGVAPRAAGGHLWGLFSLPEKQAGAEKSIRDGEHTTAFAVLGHLAPAVRGRAGFCCLPSALAGS